MKKIFIAVYLLYGAESVAMHTMKNVMRVTAPLAVAGSYYYCKTNIHQAKLREMLQREQDEARLSADEIEERVNDEDTFRPFVQGAVWGTVPVLNYIVGMFSAGKFLIDLDAWATHGNVSAKSSKELNAEKKSTATSVGYVSGLSVYPLTMLAWIKKVK